MAQLAIIILLGLQLGALVGQFAVRSKDWQLSSALFAANIVLGTAAIFVAAMHSLGVV